MTETKLCYFEDCKYHMKAKTKKGGGIMKIYVELEFDEEALGPKWMNIDNLKLLLYGKWETKEELLKITSYKEGE